jgi:hypothetical protein
VLLLFKRWEVFKILFHRSLIVALAQGLVLMKECVDSLVLDSCATTSKSFLQKLLRQGVTCQHVIVTAVNCEMFNPAKRNMCAYFRCLFYSCIIDIAVTEKHDRN